MQGTLGGGSLVTVASNALLQLNGTLAAGPAGSSLDVAGTLAGNAVINRPVTFDGGTLSPGNSAGTVQFIGDGTRALTLSSNTVVKLELQNGVAGVDYDQLVVTNGFFNLNDAELRLELIGAVTNGADFVIVRNLQEDFSTLGQFRFGDTLVGDGETNAFGSAQLFVITYGADFDADGYYIVLTAVIPEPSAGLLVGAGLLVLLTFRRRRND